MDNTLKYVCLLLLVGFGVSGCVDEVAPFSDRSSEVYNFQYTSLNVTGVVWSFERDGNYVSFGGPVGLIYEDSREFALSVSGTGIELSTASDVVGTVPGKIRDLLDAADRFCADAGYFVRDRRGADIHTTDGTLLLIGYCGPDA